MEDRKLWVTSAGDLNFVWLPLLDLGEYGHFSLRGGLSGKALEILNGCGASDSFLAMTSEFWIADSRPQRLETAVRSRQAEGYLGFPFAENQLRFLELIHNQDASRKLFNPATLENEFQQGYRKVVFNPNPVAQLLWQKSMEEVIAPASNHPVWA